MTGIEWTHRPGTVPRTWNPTKGCSRMSEGCRHCYAEQQAARIVRMGKGKPTAYDGLVRLVNGEARWTGEVRIVPDALALPLRWRARSTVFVNSMSDLFHESLTNEQIAAVFGVMAACPQHTFIVLTKRAKRMREWFAWAHDHRSDFAEITITTLGEEGHDYGDGAMFIPDRWPLPNVWLGVSVENQDAADERIPELLATPAAVRLLSCEPLLGPVDLRRVRPSPMPIDALTGRWSVPHQWGRQEPRVHWVIAGCESGADARFCDPAWLRSLRDQCAAAGAKYFLKQAVADELGHGTARTLPVTTGPGSKRKTGGVIGLPYLDGVQHAHYPQTQDET